MSTELVNEVMQNMIAEQEKAIKLTIMAESTLLHVDVSLVFGENLTPLTREHIVAHVIPRKNRIEVFRHIRTIQLLITKLLRQNDTEEMIKVITTLVVHLLNIVNSPEAPMSLKLRFEEI